MVLSFMVANHEHHLSGNDIALKIEMLKLFNDWRMQIKKKFANKIISPLLKPT